MSRYDLLKGRKPDLPEPEKKQVGKKIPQRSDQSRKHFLSNLRVINKINGRCFRLTENTQFNLSVASAVSGPEIQISLSFDCPISDVEWMMPGINLSIINVSNGQELVLPTVSIATNFMEQTANVTTNLICTSEESTRFLGAVSKKPSSLDIPITEQKIWNDIDKAIS